MTTTPALIVGLGNPGRQYEANRHNAGFLAVDEIARVLKFTGPQSKFNGELLSGTVDGRKVYLLKPQTYMNLSGSSVQAAAAFYKIPPSEITVLHDELDIPLGQVRVKQGGGSGGHNGIKSIDGALGPNYWRLRLGIGHPGRREMVDSHVLSDFYPAERDAFNALISKLPALLPALLAHDAVTLQRELSVTPPAA